MITSDRINHLFLYDNLNDDKVIVPYKMFGKLVEIDQENGYFIIEKDVLKTWEGKKFIIGFETMKNLVYIGPGNLDDYPEYLL